MVDINDSDASGAEWNTSRRRERICLYNTRYKEPTIEGLLCNQRVVTATCHCWLEALPSGTKGKQIDWASADILLVITSEY